MKISVNIPTYNEEKIIRKVIRNVKAVADEIILIDNSTDKTTSLAKQEFKNVKIIHCKEKDFSKIRNKGIKNVRKGWYILYLDADEFLSKKLINEIKALKKKKDCADIYLIKRKHFFVFDNSVACLTTRFVKGEPKLFKKGTVKFVNKIHEKAVFIKQNLRIEKLKGSTLHYPDVSRKKYEHNGKYFKILLNNIIKEKNLSGFVRTNIKQLIKYLLIFDYHPKYWKGNLRAWTGTLKLMLDIIKEYFKTLL